MHPPPGGRGGAEILGYFGMVVGRLKKRRFFMKTKSYKTLYKYKHIEHDNGHKYSIVSYEMSSYKTRTFIFCLREGNLDAISNKLSSFFWFPGSI